MSTSRIEPEMHLLAAVLTGNASLLQDHQIKKAQAAGKTVMLVQINAHTPSLIQGLVTNTNDAMDRAIDKVIENLLSVANNSFSTGISTYGGNIKSSRHYIASLEKAKEAVTRLAEDNTKMKLAMQLEQETEENRQLKIKRQLMASGQAFNAKAFDAFVERIRATGDLSVEQAVKAIEEEDRATYENAMKMMEENAQR